MKHLLYLKYLIRHKWFVMLACFRYGLYWRGIKHDWSKFLPCEWFPYAQSFYGPQPRTDETKVRFDRAWLHHQHFNPHHWQHWVLREDSGATKILEMHWDDMLEMLADWEGAGRAITGNKDTRTWYLNNQDKILLHPYTKEAVRMELGLNTPPTLLDVAAAGCP
jgi:hypothetical protein